ncbi:Cro/C1-type helix-turn-helix domain [Burkholderiaceae bacterium]
MITSAQIRAARALIKWTGAELSKKSGVAFSTVMRLEAGEGVPGAQAKTLNAINKAFEAAGIEFIGTPESGAGVRWRL